MQNFDFVGHFYEIEGRKCRKYLDIKAINSKLDQPDLMVVMMNPGSSYPLDKIDNNSVPTITAPDPTQDQIMMIMRNSSLEFARILNLSDFREPASSNFYKFLKSDESKLIPHSIFSESRAIDFSKLFRPNVPIVYAWGVSPSLTDLAKMAMKRISAIKPIGVKKHVMEYAYYHPLPRGDSKQKEWVNAVSEMLKNA